MENKDPWDRESAQRYLQHISGFPEFPKQTQNIRII